MFLGNPQAFCLHLVGRVGADPTTLVRGTVLQTAEFADSLYLPILSLLDTTVGLEPHKSSCYSAISVPGIWVFYQNLNYVVIWHSCPDILWFSGTSLSTP